MDTKRWKSKYHHDAWEKKSKSLSMMAIMLLASFFALTPSFVSSSSTSQTHADIIIGFDDPIFHEKQIQNTTFTEVTIASCFQMGRSGTPSLPIYAAHILLPKGKTISQIKVTASSIKDYSYKITDKPIIPQQPSRSFDNITAGFSFNESTYKKEQPLYETMFSNQGIDYCRGYPIVTLHIFPLQYTPAHKSLLFFKKIHLSIDFIESTYNHPLLRNNNDDRTSITSFICNPDMLSSYNEQELSLSSSTSETEQMRSFSELYPGGLCHPSESYSLVIITNNDLRDTTGYLYNWTDLLNHRLNNDGLTGCIITVEEIDACSVYWNDSSIFNDSAAHIREFCKDAYLDWETSYILLGGSWQISGSNYQQRQIVPCRFFTDRYESQTYDSIPCDLYYSNLDGDWYYASENLWGGGRYGANDKFSELAIGRIPVWNAEMISHSIQKILWYDACQNSTWLSSCGFLGGYLGWSTTSKEYLEELRFGTGSWAYYRGFEEWNSINPTYLLDTSHRFYEVDYSSESAAIDACKTAINTDQISILNHLDHGYMSNTFSMGTGSSLSNSHFFFGTSQACLSGRYTEGTCGATTFMSSWDDRGAFAMMLNTGYGYGNPGNTEGASQLQQKILWNYFFENQSTDFSEWQLGKASQYTKDMYSSMIDSYSHAYCYVWYSWQLFGDPAQQLRITATNQNTAPQILFTNPSNETENVNVSTQQLRAIINDTDNDTLYWEITTQPDIGSSNGSINGGGTIVCSIQNLSYYQQYHWNLSLFDTVAWTNETYCFTTEMDPTNQAPVLGIPTPLNESLNQSLDMMWQIPISDVNNDTINWTITCSSQTTNMSQMDTAGLKTVTLENLSYNHIYYLWVNVTDGILWTRQWFTFSTRDSYSPIPPVSVNFTVRNRTAIQLQWDTTTRTDAVYIERNTTETWVKGNGKQIYTGSNQQIIDSGLAPGTTYYYQLWSWNQTDQIYSSNYSSIQANTMTNQPVHYGNITPNNNTGNISLELNWTINLSDSEGDAFNWTIQCSNGQNKNVTLAGNGTKNIFLTNLLFNTTYTVWVNATDTFENTCQWYVFTTLQQTDFTLPYLSQIQYTTSSPRDTQQNYGWENITCTITDNIAISNVYLRIICPNTTTLNLSMQKYQQTQRWFANMTLQEHGNYSWIVHAVDTSRNSNQTAVTLFSLVPNWDITSNGCCDDEDIEDIADHYGLSGQNGWIRSDVDNNGHIEVLDFVLCSNHYNETWMG